MPDRIRVLITDDSAFMRYTIANNLLAEPDIEVVGLARNGLEAIEMVKQLRPDVVTLDVEMPIMDGLTALRRIMAEAPSRVIMLSSSTTDGATATLEALEAGAIDFVTKPSGPKSLDIHKVKQELLAKVRGVVSARLGPLRPTRAFRLQAPQVQQRKTGDCGQAPRKVLVIGSSTGGPAALSQVVPGLPADLSAAVLIVQHMPAGFTSSFAQRLDKISGLSIKEAEPEEPLKTGQVLIAPGDQHMLVDEHGRIKLDCGPRIHGVRPAVDVTLKSVAKTFGSRSVAVILTGMGSDGRDGCAAIKAAGGATLVEDESSCVVFGMPKSVIEAGLADRVSPLSAISDQIVAMLR